MTYAEWEKRPTSVNDAECATVIMGWYLSNDGSTWCTHGECLCAAKSDGETEPWSPTTDRNATAMLVEEVGQRGKMVEVLTRILVNGSGLTSFLEAIELGLRAAPSLVAWACCEACREGK